MRKKRLTRSVCVMLSEEMYRQIAEITDDKEISISDYIRDAIQMKLADSNTDKSITDK